MIIANKSPSHRDVRQFDDDLTNVKGLGQNQGTVSVQHGHLPPLSSQWAAPVTHLHPCGIQPVGDVPYGHVHWQDDGLAVVVQARGDTF